MNQLFYFHPVVTCTTTWNGKWGLLSISMSNTSHFVWHSYLLIFINTMNLFLQIKYIVSQDIYHLTEAVLIMSLLFPSSLNYHASVFTSKLSQKMKDAQGRSQPFTFATEEMPSISRCAKYSIETRVKQCLWQIINQKQH